MITSILEEFYRNCFKFACLCKNNDIMAEEIKKSRFYLVVYTSTAILFASSFILLSYRLKMKTQQHIEINNKVNKFIQDLNTKFTEKSDGLSYDITNLKVNHKYLVDLIDKTFFRNYKQPEPPQIYKQTVETKRKLSETFSDLIDIDLN